MPGVPALIVARTLSTNHPLDALPALDYWYLGTMNQL